MATPESKVKDAIKGWLKANGAYQLWPVQTGYGAATVDALLCINGRFIGLETKRPGRATPTPRQRIVMDAIEAAGGWAFCVDSLDEFLKQYVEKRSAVEHWSTSLREAAR